MPGEDRAHRDDDRAEGEQHIQHPRAIGEETERHARRTEAKIGAEEVARHGTGTLCPAELRDHGEAAEIGEAVAGRPGAGRPGEDQRQEPGPGAADQRQVAEREQHKADV